MLFIEAKALLYFKVVYILMSCIFYACRVFLQDLLVDHHYKGEFAPYYVTLSQTNLIFENTYIRNKHLCMHCSRKRITDIEFFYIFCLI